MERDPPADDEADEEECNCMDLDMGWGRVLVKEPILLAVGRVEAGVGRGEGERGVTGVSEGMGDCECEGVRRGFFLGLPLPLFTRGALPSSAVESPSSPVHGPSSSSVFGSLTLGGLPLLFITLFSTLLAAITTGETPGGRTSTLRGVEGERVEEGETREP